MACGAQTTSCWYVHVERNFMIDIEVYDCGSIL